MLCMGAAEGNTGENERDRKKERNERNGKKERKKGGSREREGKINKKNDASTCMCGVE